MPCYKTFIDLGWVCFSVVYKAMPFQNIDFIRNY